MIRPLGCRDDQLLSPNIAQNSAFLYPLLCWASPIGGVAANTAPLPGFSLPMWMRADRTQPHWKVNTPGFYLEFAALLRILLSKKGK